jgi:dTDP-4-dehydrorhamnose reductase
MSESKSQRILVTGAKGMLAGHLLPKLNGELLLTDLKPGSLPHFAGEVHALDITNRKEVEALCGDFKPSWIINCAAYTAVDLAETEQEIAFEVNAIGPGNLARAAKLVGGRLLHISTDYLFTARSLESTLKRTPINEDEIPAAKGIYGISKYLGEELVKAHLPEHSLIVRTSWLHGVYGPNFLATILRLAAEKPELKIVSDQIGSPTWAEWLASVLVRLMEKEANGIYHASSRGDISWYDFAKEIVSQAGLNCKILPQSTEELSRPAPRPAYSTFNLTKLEQFLGIDCISWRDGIKEHLRCLQKN